MAAGGEPLLDMALLKIPRMQAGLNTYVSQQFMIMGIFFVLPLYLQTVLGYDSLQTGITILPLSLSLFVCALLGASLSARMSPKRIVTIGLVLMLAGVVLLIAFTGPDLRSVGFAVALALVGAGNGLLVSQLGNVIMSSVPARARQRGRRPAGDGDEPGRLAGDGAGRLDPDCVAGHQLPDRGAGEPGAGGCEQRTSGSGGAERQLRQRRAGVCRRAKRQGLSPEQVDAVVAEYADAQIAALKAAFAVVGLCALVALWYVRRLPTEAVAIQKEPEGAPATAT